MRGVHRGLIRTKTEGRSRFRHIGTEYMLRSFRVLVCTVNQPNRRRFGVVRLMEVSKSICLSESGRHARDRTPRSLRNVPGLDMMVDDQRRKKQKVCRDPDQGGPRPAGRGPTIVLIIVFIQAMGHEAHGLVIEDSLYTTNTLITRSSTLRHRRSDYSSAAS